MATRTQWFEIPAGTKVSVCRGCQEQAYWISTTTGNRMLVDLTEAGSVAPTKAEHGKGISHFARCPKSDQFRTRRAPATR